MIRISVDTEMELEYMRRVLRDEACSHNTCGHNDKTECFGCVENYFKDCVQLYKRSTVEIAFPIVVK